MNKEKLVKIKNKIKVAAPAIVIISATAGAAAIAFYSLKPVAIKAIEKDNTNLLPTITGDEKFAILGRCDLILQKIEDNLYFLSFDDTKTED